MRLRSYTELIDGSKDGEAFRLIAKGLLLFGIWLPLSAILTGFSSQYYLSHPSATDALTILNNYANVLLLGVAFLYVYYGSRRLLVLIKKPISSLSQPLTLAYIAFSALYVLLVLHDPVRQFPSHDVARASYYEPDWLIITTIVIPRLLMWFLGIQAVRNILLYREKVKGRLYRVALNNLALGLGGIVLTTVALRCLQSISVTFAQFGLGLVLLIIYILLIAIAVGYVMVAKGAEKLKNLEKI